MNHLLPDPSTQRGGLAEPQAARKARSRFVVPLVVAFSLVTGLLVGLARPIDSAHPVATPPVDAETAVAQRFYGAVNAAIAGGDATRLDDVVAEDFADHTPSSEAVGNRADLKRAVRDLAASDPSLHLTTIDVIAQGDRVVARLQVDGDAGQMLFGIPIEGAHPWSDVEILRVAHGKIAERWVGSDATAPPQKLVESTIEVDPPAWKLISLVRLTMSAGGDDYRSQATGQSALLVERGLLVATIDPQPPTVSTSVVRASATGQPPMTETVKPGRRVTIGAGDLLVFGEGARYALANDGTAETSALLLTAAAPFDPGGAPMVTPTPLSHVSISELAPGMSSLLPLGSADLAIGRVTLAPAAAMASHTVTGPELVVLESGTLHLSADGNTPWFRSGVDGSGHVLSDGALAAGDSVLVPAGTTVDYRNGGQTPAIFLLVRLTPGLATPVAAASS